MKWIIDMPEEIYEMLVYTKNTRPHDLSKGDRLILDGTPLTKTGQFAEWVATEIFDENWEYNKYAFAEIACRKLAKLGIVRAKGDEWELTEPQESEDKNVNKKD